MPWAQQNVQTGRCWEREQDPRCLSAEATGAEPAGPEQSSSQTRRLQLGGAWVLTCLLSASVPCWPWKHASRRLWEWWHIDRTVSRRRSIYGTGTGELCEGRTAIPAS